VSLPSGTVTFLFTDVERSTSLLHELGAEGYADALAAHRATIREACARHGGAEVDTQGDALFVAFGTAPAALEAASEAQSELAAGPVRVRMGLHTGTPLLTEEGYVGIDVHRAARIAAAGHGGQVLLSRSTAALADGFELRDLGEHRFKDLAGAERVYQLGAADFTPLKSLGRTNLPVPATPFLGREEELAAVETLLVAGDVRLVTLTGPPGAGKTRLALQAAAEASEAFQNGILWISLSALRDSAPVAGALAAAAGIDPPSDRPVEETLAERLGATSTLILLDNAEHLLPDIAETIAFLRDLDGPTLLVTSRERLRLQGEQAWPVPPLTEEDGQALFVARASAVDPSFHGSDAVAEVCARLDELPLAIELAAARTAVFTVEQLLDRLSRRLDLLKGVRDADPRQRTLRATIEWSYDLLDAAEQRALAALSVFAGGCTLEAAEDVSRVDVDTLESLIDKSLLRRRETPFAPRYWMLESIREFAAERLEEKWDAAAIRARHAARMADLADELWDARHDEELRSLAEPLDLEQGNLRVAIAHAMAGRDADLLLRLARGTSFLWVRRGMARNADAVLEGALEFGAAGDPGLRLDALCQRSYVQARLKEDRGAVASGEQAVALAREHGDPRRLGHALSYLGSALMGVDAGAAHATLEEAVLILRTHGATPELTDALQNLANVHVLNRKFDAARAVFAETLDLGPDAATWGSWGRAAAHLNLAQALYHLGRYDEALRHARAGAAEKRKTGGPIGLADCVFVAAAVVAARGEARQAGVLLGVVDRTLTVAGEQLEAMEAFTRETIFERASSGEREALDQGMRAEPAPTVEQAFAETFPDV